MTPSEIPDGPGLSISHFPGTNFLLRGRVPLSLTGFPDFPFLSTDGTISSSSILLAQSLQHCIHSQSCSATDLFYQGSSQTLREWLSVAITRTLHQGEDSLLELTKQICAFLQVQA